MDDPDDNDEGMLVPVAARRSDVFLIHGDGVPVKVAIGGRGCDERILLHLANDRRRDGPYLHVERVLAGAVMLHDRPHQGSDYATTRRWNNEGNSRRSPGQFMCVLDESL